GAAGVDLFSSVSVSQAGAIYALYGSPRRVSVPTSFEVLANQSVTGIGDFLVDNGTGRPEVYTGVSSPGASTLIQFTTIGDGQAGDTLRLLSFPNGASTTQPTVFAPSVTVVGQGSHKTPDGQVGNDSSTSTFRVGGAGKLQAAIEFDLSGLMEAYDDPNDIVSALLSLDATITGLSVDQPSLTLDGRLNNSQDGVSTTGAFFIAGTPETGREIWYTNGTTGQTGQLTDFSPGTSSTQVLHAAVSGDWLFYSTATPPAVWVTGIGISTQQITNALPATTGMVAWQGQALFVAGGNLYKTNVGVGFATYELVRAGVSSTALNHTVLLNNKLFFMSGSTLYVTDGTDAGTIALRTFVAGGDGIPNFSQAVAFNNKIYFAADSDTDAISTNNAQTELWMSDGTVAGTAQVRTFDTVAANPPTLSTVSNPPDTVMLPWINEFHYDNVDPDANESIEIGGPAGYNLTGWSLALYRQSPTPQNYGTINLTGALPSNMRSGFSFRSFAAAGLHDGPAGIALIGPGGFVRQFLSYEGTITATSGPAAGRTSINIGVSEAPTETSQKSLQLSGKLGQFTWQAPAANSQNFPNAGQYFLSPPREFQVVGNRMVFLVEDSLFVSNGTAGGTNFVAQVGAVSNAILRTHVVGSKYYLLHQTDLGNPVYLRVLDLTNPVAPVLSAAIQVSGFTDGLGEVSHHNNQLVFSNSSETQLWSSDGTSRGTQLRVQSSYSSIRHLNALPSGRFMFIGNTSPSESLTTLLVMNPGSFDPVPLNIANSANSTLLVSLLNEEGDGLVTGRDFSVSLPATIIANRTMLTSPIRQRVDFALGNAIRNAIAEGKTRISLRLTSPNTSTQWTIQQPSLTAESGLRITRRPKLVADLLNSHGGVLEEGIQAMDLRHIPAGTYYLKLYQPDVRFSSWEVPYQIEVMPPAQGQVNGSLPDSDRLEGGDGADTLVGGSRLDELFGESGNDIFVGEDFEIRDREQNELFSPIATEDRLNADTANERDPIIVIPDPGLRVQIAQALGIPMTDRHESGLPLFKQFAVDVRASDLAKLTELPPIDPQYVFSLKGLEYATNLVGLNLSGQTIFDLSNLDPALDLNGDPTGLAHLRYLNLNGALLADLSSLGQLRHLRVLMADLPNHSESDVFRIDVYQAYPTVPITGLPEFNSLNHVAVGGGNSLSFTR
ncbi:MAG: hypothetical protein IT423_03900, partial [Pirellulaceae bacterium]|nr:hypothetical protein [Pirellulaceae bacterium]